MDLRRELYEVCRAIRDRWHSVVCLDPGASFLLSWHLESALSLEARAICRFEGPASPDHSWEGVDVNIPRTLLHQVKIYRTVVDKSIRMYKYVS